MIARRAARDQLVAISVSDRNLRGFDDVVCSEKEE
jgi:hypothetical protein